MLDELGYVVARRREDDHVIQHFILEIIIIQRKTNRSLRPADVVEDRGGTVNEARVWGRGRVLVE
jgi:hypothetical protein